MKQINTSWKLCLLTLSLFVFLSKTAKSQNYKMGFAYSGTSSVEGDDIGIDAAGNKYVVGKFLGTADFDPSVGTANLTITPSHYNMYIAKYDATGNYIWSVKVGGIDSYITANDMKVTAAGNIYITGFQAGTVDFDPTGGTQNHTAGGAYDAFVAKYDASGNLVWVNNLGNSNTDRGYGLVLDAAENVYVTGDFSGTVDFDPSASTANITATHGEIFMAKYTSAGAYVWAKGIGGFNNQYARDITIDAAGNLYLIGEFFGNADFGGGAIVSVQWHDAFIAKFDNTGNYIWANVIGTDNQDFGASIGVDAAGNVYATGTISGTGDFDPSAATDIKTTVGFYDFFMVKYNASGTYQWGHSWGSTNYDTMEDMEVDASGNVYILGYFYDVVDFDFSATTQNLTSAGSNDIFFAKYDAAGNYQWAHSIGTTGGEIARGMLLDANNNLLLTGVFSNTMDLDPSANTANVNGGNSGTFVAEYGPPEGTALDFDGNNDYVNSLGGFTEQSFTVEMWLNPSATQSNLAVIVDNNHNGAQNWVLQQNFGTTNNYWFFTPSSPDIFFSIPANTWSHVVLVNENTTNGKKVYVNGVLQGQVTPTGNIPYNATNLRLGGWYAGGRPWDGKMDEFRLWNRALCLTEIIGQKDCALTGSESGLVAYYNFNQGIEDGTNTTETTLLDRTANNNNGTLVNFGLSGSSSNWTSGSANGVSGTCSTVAFSEARVLGNAVEILDGANSPTTTNDTEFGAVCSANPVTKIFTLENTGLGALNITSITSSNAAFAISNSPATTVASSSSTTIEITFTPTANNTSLSTITINNNDCDEAVYTFDVQGTGTLSPADETVTAAQATVCPNVATTVDVGGSESGVNYYLRNDANDAVVAGPLAGTGAGLSFNTGNLTATTTYNVYAEGSSTALNFNSNQYINSNGLPTFANNFTIEAWVNPTSTHQIDGQSTSGTGGTGGQKYMLWPTHRGGEAGIGISVGTNGISVYEHGGGYMPSLLTWTGTINTWTHIAVVYVNKQPRLYVNGTLVATGLTSIRSNCYPSLGRANAIYPNNGGIGGGSYGSFDGSIDDFRLWSVSRTATEIQNNMNTCLVGTEPNLYALYNFEDGTGSSTLTDLTGNNNGTLTNMDANTDWISGASVCATCPREMTQKATVTFDPGTLVGNDKRGEMYDLGNVENGIHIGDLGAVNDWTIETWFKPNGWNNYENVFHTDVPLSGSSNQGVRLELSSNYGWGHMYFGLSSTNTWVPRTILPLGSTVSSSEWHHIAIVGDKTNSRVYVYLNGELLVNSANTNWPANFSNFYIGKGFIATGSGRDFSGNLDEFRIWSTARTQGEIRENMHLSLTDCQTGLAAYYQFDNDDPVGTANGVKDAMGTHHGTTVNMMAADKVASEVAVGQGMVDRVTITGAGVQNFPNTGLSMTFGASHPNGELVVTRIGTERPHGWSSTGLDVDNEYFVVHNFGTNTFTALSDITFNNIGTIDAADAATPNVFSLFKRGSNEFGATWGTALGNAVTATAGANGSVSFDNTTNITSFSQFVIGTPLTQASDLPIELLNFEATRMTNEVVELDWTTAIEVNNKGFYIERMLAVEGIFETIGFVEGQGTISHTTYYNLEDQNAYSGVSYYRLKQVDFDGTVSYSPIRAVEGRQGVTKTIDKVQIYPNPISNLLKVKFDDLSKEIKNATIRITNTLGQEIINYEMTVQAYQVVTIKGVEGLTPATYFLNIELDNGEIINHKFIKNKE